MKKVNLFLILSAIMILIQKNYVFDNYFDTMQQIINNNVTFVENGVRIEYPTKCSVDKEIKNVKNRISKFFNINNIEENNSTISASLDNSKIEADFYSNNSTTYVSINLINYDKTKKISTLMNEITHLQGDNSNELKYFKYIKGKINNEKNILECINEEKIIKNLKILDIHNGYVGTAYLDNGEKVNIAYSNYNTGSYFIIGSPIIFTTY